jgi:hypothetical protein
MEWEEALLIARCGARPSHPSDYYRRKASHVRQVADEVTTRAVKLRLLNEAAQYDELAGDADRAADNGCTVPPV